MNIYTSVLSPLPFHEWRDTSRASAQVISTCAGTVKDGLDNIITEEPLQEPTGCEGEDFLEGREMCIQLRSIRDRPDDVLRVDLFPSPKQNSTILPDLGAKRTGTNLHNYDKAWLIDEPVLIYLSEVTVFFQVMIQNSMGVSLKCQGFRGLAFEAQDPLAQTCLRD